MLTKEEVLECFFKERQNKKEILELADIYNKYLTRVPLQPANLEKIETITSKLSENQEKKSSLDKTLSICSAFSRVTIDKTIYVDIIQNRKKHNIFLELEDDDLNEKKWHYMDDKGNIFGLFSSQQMNDLFQLYKFNDKYKVKKKFDNDDFVPFKLLIKRYYKKILAEKLDIEKSRSRALSKKTVEFRKGDLIKNKGKNKIEKFSSQGRVQRVLSDEVKPNLYFLDDIVEESDNDEEELQPGTTRIRSLTSATK